MAVGPASVRTDLDLRLVVPGSVSVPLLASLRYEVSDPYAVHLRFPTQHGGEGDAVEWTFARQLLTDGVSRPAGDGDVRVWPVRHPSHPRICLSLSSPSGWALFEVPLGRLVEYLAQTYSAVPTGRESDFIDVDAELALLLADQPGS